MRLVKKLATLGIVSALCISFSAMVSAADATTCTTKYKGVTTTVTAKTVSDRDNDCTYFRITNSKAKKKTQNLIIDMGATKDTDEKKRPYYKAFSKAFLDELEKDNYVIDHLVITHGHEDHIYGIKYLRDKLKENNKKQEGVQKITINNLYINGLNMEQGKMYWLKIQNLLETNYFDVKHVYCFGVLGLGDSKYVTQDTLKLLKRFKNFTEANNYLCQPKWVEITGTGVVFKVIPPMYYHTESGSQGANNNSLIVTIQDEKSDEKSKDDKSKLKEFKYIMPGDIQSAAIRDIMTKTKKVDRKGPDGKVQKDVTYNYQSYIEKKENSFDGGYKKVILKVPHHGKARIHELVWCYKDKNNAYDYPFPNSISDINQPDIANKLKPEIGYSDANNKTKDEKTFIYGLGFLLYKYYKPFQTKYNNEGCKYIRFGELGKYEKQFIEIIQPDIIVGTNWNLSNLSSKAPENWTFKYGTTSLVNNNIAVYRNYLKYCVTSGTKIQMYNTFSSKAPTQNSAFDEILATIETFRTSK